MICRHRNKNSLQNIYDDVKVSLHLKKSKQKLNDLHTTNKLLVILIE